MKVIPNTTALLFTRKTGKKVNMLLLRSMLGMIRQNVVLKMVWEGQRETAACAFIGMVIYTLDNALAGQQFSSDIMDTWKGISYEC